LFLPLPFPALQPLYGCAEFPGWIEHPPSGESSRHGRRFGVAALLSCKWARQAFHTCNCRRTARIHSEGFLSSLPPLFSARGKAADLQTEVNRQKLAGLRNNIARDVRTSWQDTARAYERLSVTQQLREQPGLALDLAQARYNLGLGSIVEFTQAELQKTEADIADTDARCQYRLTQIVLAYTISSSK
jgi:hypothetical protein